ncbi:hypothetical protein ACFPRL_12210 [Pseudoclavibacter helvolus]
MFNENPMRCLSAHRTGGRPCRSGNISSPRSRCTPPLSSSTTGVLRAGNWCRFPRMPRADQSPT